jgi:hypothetical protein
MIRAHSFIRIYTEAYLFCKVERLFMGGEEKKEADWLRELCRGDSRLYDVLANTLYLDPKAAISKEDLGILIEKAEKSAKDDKTKEAVQKYGLALDKAIFEATQHQEEKQSYIETIQDLVSKSVQATQKLKEKAEKEGIAPYAAGLERRIGCYRFVSEKIIDVMEVASHFYNERLEMLKEKDRGEARRSARAEERSKVGKEEKWDKKRDKQRREERLEEDREEEREEKREKEKGGARREKILQERR